MNCKTVSIDTSPLSSKPKHSSKQINVRKGPLIEDGPPGQNKQEKHQIKDISEADHQQNMNRYMHQKFWDSKIFNFTKSKKATTFQCSVAHQYIKQLEDKNGTRIF